jgi:hypothetical protein
MPLPRGSSKADERDRCAPALCKVPPFEKLRRTRQLANDSDGRLSCDAIAIITPGHTRSFLHIGMTLDGIHNRSFLLSTLLVSSSSHINIAIFIHILIFLSLSPRDQLAISSRPPQRIMQKPRPPSASSVVSCNGSIRHPCRNHASLRPAAAAPVLGNLSLEPQLSHPQPPTEYDPT